MAKYHLTNKAVEGLSNIWNYTYENWGEEQADKYYTVLLNFCETLAGQPSTGKKYDEVITGIWGCKVNQHIIFYTAIAAKEIEVIRILHSQMDLKTRLLD
jgi:toxin ParE1/3/4